MKPHYFGQDAPDADDLQLAAAIQQGYVPAGCLLGGFVVMGEVGAGRDACAGCRGPREKCGGRYRKATVDLGDAGHGPDLDFEDFTPGRERERRKETREQQADGALSILDRMNRHRPIPGSNREFALVIADQERDARAED